MVRLNSTSLVPGSSSPLPKSPYVTPHNTAPNRQAIALISEHADPAAEIGKEEIGGQNVYVRRVGETLAKLGWQVDMFTRKTRSDEAAIVQHSPHCRTIRLTAGPEQYIAKDELFEYMPEFVQAFQRFQTKEGSNYPLVHTNYWMSGWVGLQLKQQSNIQLVHTYHSVGIVKYQTMQQRPAIAETRLAIERQILEQANCIVATSPQEQETLRTQVSEQGYIEVIPGGADIENFQATPKAEARDRLGFELHDQIVLYVGRFEPRKGIETLIQALDVLNQRKKEREIEQEDRTIRPARLRLVIVGGSGLEQSDGQEQQRLEQIVRELGLTEQTLFVGLVGHNLLPLYYTAADVCVIPSYYEPFGLVAVEAMACGTPVVASDVGGLRFSVIPGETGLLVSPKNTAALAQAIDRILTDELWAHKLKKQASLRVQQNFSWSGVAAHLSDLYRRLLAQSISDASFWSVHPPNPSDPLAEDAPPSEQSLTRVS